MTSQRVLVRAVVVLALVAVGLAVALALLLESASSASSASFKDRRTNAYLAGNVHRATAELAACIRELDRRPVVGYRVPALRLPALTVLRGVKASKRACLLERARLVSSWTPTMLCESNKRPDLGGTYWRTLVSHNQWGTFYFGLQFVDSTWDAHRGGYPPVAVFVARRVPPTPAQQAVVASRLGYDGWPNCP